MANVDNPHGFRPVFRGFNGGVNALFPFQKDASEGTAIFPFDIVEQEADANIAPGGTPGTTRYLGVACEYGAASTLTDHLVIIDPNAVYEAQDNNDTDGVAAVDLGANANAEFNAGVIIGQSGRSGHEIDESTIAGTNTLDLKLMRLHKVPDNAFGANARIEVLINKHMMREGAGI